MPAFKQIVIASLVALAVPFSAGRAYAGPIIPNGDFGLGYSNFNSGYVYTTTSALPNPTLLGPEGAFTVGTSPNLFHNLWYDFGDHTSGTGNMLILNGHYSPDVVVWSSLVDVEADTQYDFSAWIASAYPVNPASLAFSINGTLLSAPFLASSTPGLWQEYAAGWYSGSTTSAFVSLIDLNIERDGNDFALDDIALTAAAAPQLFDLDFEDGPTDGFEQTGAVVPEPASLVLLGSGLVGLAGMLKRRDMKKAS